MPSRSSSRAKSESRDGVMPGRVRSSAMKSTSSRMMTVGPIMSMTLADGSSSGCSTPIAQHAGARHHGHRHARHLADEVADGVGLARARPPVQEQTPRLRWRPLALSGVAGPDDLDRVLFDLLEEAGRKDHLVGFGVGRLLEEGDVRSEHPVVADLDDLAPIGAEGHAPLPQLSQDLGGSAPARVASRRA